MNISAQEIVLLNFKTLSTKFEKSESAIKDEKKGVNSKTWYERGKLLQDIYHIDIEFIAEGSSKTEIKVYYKEPLSIVTDSTDPNKVTWKYERIEYVLVNGALSSWNKTKSVTDDPLDKAFDAYVKALEYDEKDKYGDKVKEQLIKLKMDYKKSGINYYYEEKLANALHDFEKVLDINKLDLFNGEKDTLMIQYAGIIARELKQYEKAANYYIELTEMDFGGPNMFLNIKNDYLLMGDSAMAIEVMEKGFNKYPDTLNIVANLIDLYIKADKIDKGLTKIKAAIADYPSSGELRYWEGRLLLNKDSDDKIDLAIEAYKKSIELNPNIYYVYYDVGFIYFLQGQDIYIQANLEKDVKVRNEINKIADEKYNLSVSMMEKALELNTVNMDIKKETLDVLKRIYYKLLGGDDPKYLDVIEKLKEY